MRIVTRILGPGRGRWRYLVLTLWYSFIFSTVLIYFTHFHGSPRKAGRGDPQPSLLHSLGAGGRSPLSRFFEDGGGGYFSLESLQRRFTGLSISRVFRTIAGDGEEGEVPSGGMLVEDLVISGNEAEVDKLLENVTRDGENSDGVGGGGFEVRLLEKVNIPVTASIEATVLPFPNDTRTEEVPPPPPVPGYHRIDNQQPLRIRCSVCAVVASSGHLLNSSAGAEIDQHPCVVRMNSATTTGFESDVGRRTDIRVVGFVNMKELKNCSKLRNEIFVDETTRASLVIAPWLYVRKVNRSTDGLYLTAKEFARVYPSTEIYVLDDQKMKRAEEIFKAEVGVSRKDAKTWLTTGWMTMLFAIDVCDAINVYGLVKDKYCVIHPRDKTPYHYYPPYDKTECEYYKKSEERLTVGHKFITEKAVFERWANVHKIAFHYPHWQPSNSTLNRTLETPFLRKYNAAKNAPQQLFRNGTRVVRRVIRRVVKKVIVRRRVPANKTVGKDP